MLCYFGVDWIHLFAVCRGNKGAGGCAIALKNASATFMKPTQIVDNEVIKYLDGSGAALNAETSSIVFNGPVTVARNKNTRGAGGACYLKHSNVTFNAAASVQNNSASGWNGVRKNAALTALLKTIQLACAVAFGDHTADSVNDCCAALAVSRDSAREQLRSCPILLECCRPCCLCEAHTIFWPRVIPRMPCT
jgi:hypothetical protein